MASKAELEQVVGELLDEQLVQITGGRRVRTPDGEVTDPDAGHVSNADVLTALEALPRKIAAEVLAAMRQAARVQQ